MKFQLEKYGFLNISQFLFIVKISLMAQSMGNTISFKNNFIRINFVSPLTREKKKCLSVKIYINELIREYK